MKKKIRLRETELVKLISNVISEQEVNEQIFRSLLNKMTGGLSKTPSVIINNSIELGNEIKRLIPKNNLSDKKEMSRLITKLGNLGNESDLYKVNYIKKYGQKEYDNLILQYLYDNIDKKELIGILSNVKNPTIRLKPIMGLGREHKVFESVIYPNKIIKVETTPGTVNKWYNIFKSRPDIFPEIFKTIKVNGKEGEKLIGVVLERLDTSKFTKLWDEIESEMYPLFKNLPISEREVSLEGIVKYIKTPKVKKQWEELLIFTKKQNPSLSKSIDEFSKMVNELYKITPNPDIRKFNFGYTDKGVLKCLDI